MIIDQEITSLFKKIKISLGWPVRQIQIEDEQFCALLEMAIEDYAKEVQNWIIENQWASLYGKNLSSTDITFALSTRSLDIMKDYSYYFSKEIGQQQNGPWELKKDFFVIEEGKQDYIIPAGREINKVLFSMPSTMNAAMYSNMNGGNYALAGVAGLSQFGGGLGGSMMNGAYIFSSYDVLALSADINLKSRMIRGDVTYYVTSMGSGEKIVHITPTPSKGTMGKNSSWSLYGLLGAEIWYTYYDLGPDINDPEVVKNLRTFNPDVMISPDQVPLSKMEYYMLNEPTKVLVRQLLSAQVKMTLGMIRGYFSGKISIPDAELQMDYQMLLSQGKEEKDATLRELKERLERMNPVNQSQKAAELVENTKRVLSGTPMKIYIK